MSRNLRAFVIVALWLLYVIVLVRFGPEWLCTACLQESAATDAALLQPIDSVTQRVDTVNTHPLAFRWNSAEPVEGPGAAAYVSRIRRAGSERSSLEITGLYYDGESAPEGENIGLARARRIREAYFRAIPDDRISLRARAFEEQAGAREGYFQAAVFQWMEPEAQLEATVEELSDRILIRFPFGSVQKDYDPAVDAYLDRLAVRIRNTGEQVRLTGHTDDVDTEAVNYRLGMARADEIRQILLDKGAPSGQILVESRGETQPVAPNTSEEGRHSNRRVEVRLIKTAVESSSNQN